MTAPIRITGYGIRSANDCPGRDPRKWDVKFYLGNNPQESQSYKEAYLKLKDVETPAWPDRF